MNIKPRPSYPIISSVKGHSIVGTLTQMKEMQSTMKAYLLRMGLNSLHDKSEGT